MMTEPHEESNDREKIVESDERSDEDVEDFRYATWSYIGWGCRGGVGNNRRGGMFGGRAFGDVSMASFLVFAAKKGDDPVVVAIILVVVIVATVVGLAIQGTARYDLKYRNGLPIRPRCNRQVSYKREHCRACGFRFKSYGPSESKRAAADREANEAIARSRLRDQQLADRYAAESKVRAEARRAARAARCEARDQRYRDRGAEPGRLAWFRVLPDWAQAVTLGLVFALPVLALLSVALSRMGQH